MPLIIAAANEQKWIDPALSKEEITKLIKPYDEADMMAYTVSQKANSPRNDRNIPEILQAVDYPELSLL
jgi:putative SOS response-associated peptidase YedK